ncbi:Zinc finger protein 554 [Eumeta japonica]|uniref:Zinc finger protein 554 n=1 Tax=Eumeta variegata TaxID=151549 RepID=A0A4C1VWN9_EUMVA|nr:Zinc finger protein 554 [Eumeta japonica]
MQVNLAVPDTVLLWSDDVQDQILRVDERTADEIKSRFMCITCEKFFTTESGCAKHIKRTHSEALVSCPLCEAKFRLEMYKKQHLALDHNVEEITNGERTVLVDCLDKFECDICGKKFNTRNSVKYHIRYHLSKQCRHCGLVFDSVVQVTDHLHEVHGEHIPTCGICGYKNRVRSLVTKHQRKVHMKEKNVECELCGESFFSSRYLSRHMIKHNPEKKYECQYCLKRFPRKNTLRQHVKIHMGLKNKVCKICNERLCAAAASLLLGRTGRWSVREIARSVILLACSAQVERDNESCFNTKCHFSWECYLESEILPNGNMLQECKVRQENNEPSFQQKKVVNTEKFKPVPRKSAEVSDVQAKVLAIHDSNKSEFMCVKCGRIFENKNVCLAHARRIKSLLHLAKAHRKEESDTAKERRLKDLPIKIQCVICAGRFCSKSIIKEHIAYHLKKQCPR